MNIHVLKFEKIIYSKKIQNFCISTYKRGIKPQSSRTKPTNFREFPPEKALVYWNADRMLRLVPTDRRNAFNFEVGREITLAKVLENIAIYFSDTDIEKQIKRIANTKHYLKTRNC